MGRLCQDRNELLCVRNGVSGLTGPKSKLGAPSQRSRVAGIIGKDRVEQTRGERKTFRPLRGPTTPPVAESARTRAA